MSELIKSQSHRLRSIEIIGGFLDGEKFDLSDGLNCVIGARGTGKTTVLEFVRYAMDSVPDDPAAHKRIQSLVERNLHGGRIQLSVETKDGLSYIITRSAGEDSVVLTEDGSPTELTLKSGGLFKIDIYSQNEVENIADEAMSQLHLIDNFESEQISAIDQKIKAVKAELAASASNITPLQKHLAALNEELATLPSVEEKLKAYGTEGGEDSEAINKGHAFKALRDREARSIASTNELLDEVAGDLHEILGKISLRAETIGSKDILDGPNGAILKQIIDGLRECGAEVDSHLKKALARIKTEKEQVAARTPKLNAAQQEQELKFRQLIEKHKEAQGKATERANLEKRRNELLAKKRECDEADKNLQNLRDNRVKMIQHLSELRDNRFSLRNQIVEMINKALAPSIRVTITQYGNPREYRKLLEAGLKDARVRRNVVASKVVDAFWPADLTDVIKAHDIQPLVDKAGLNTEQAQKVMDALSGSNVLFEMETVELIDLPKIELNDHGTYKETNMLSTGQKCNTILPILLLESENPLLIDQPEDNLDNSFVYDTIVDSIRKVKENRQLVFVTHNPNIPVLGEADKIFVMDSDGISAKRKNEGTVEHCKDDIVTLLEGGEEAFKKRKARYSY
jgi:ABC-type lipoprotein export system ATPase subunit